MGATRQGGRHQAGRRPLRSSARVVPRLATFAVDKGFWYTVPEHLARSVTVGSIVRVPLSGRRVRGYVVELGDDREGLKEVGAVSGAGPVFSEKQFRSLEWAANHYVAPLSILLDRAAPPNLPGATAPAASVQVRSPEPGLLDQLAVSSAPGRRRPPTALVGRVESAEWMRSFRHVLEAGASVMIITATVTEAAAAHSVAAELFGEAALLATGEDREVTGAWDAAQAGGRILVGTPRVAAWQVARLAVCVVIEEGRRAMKDRQTPTLHVRDLILTRARLEGFSTVFAGPTPSVETLASGAEIVTGSRRSWALVEVVDRSEDPPGAGFLSDRALAALRLVTGRGGRSFVFTHRRASDSSTRCSVCRTLRRCPRCGSNAGRRTTCARCGASLGACASCGNATFETLGTVPEQLTAMMNRSLGNGSAGLAGSGTPIEVGTERDLAGEGGFDLVIAADVDGLALGRDYRASEEALRILARLGNLVASGPGRRMMLQTSIPESALVDALRSGDPIPYLEVILAERAREGLPPSTEMLAIELRGIDGAEEAHQALREAGAPGLMGPAIGDEGFRWLVQGDLTRFRAKLRSLARSWRDREIVVRIDADPIDL